MYSATDCPLQFAVLSEDLHASIHSQRPVSQPEPRDRNTIKSSESEFGVLADMLTASSGSNPAELVRLIACARCRRRKKKCHHAKPICGECKLAGAHCVAVGRRAPERTFGHTGHISGKVGSSMEHCRSYYHLWKYGQSGWRVDCTNHLLRYWP